jgi:tyrosinase
MWQALDFDSRTYTLDSDTYFPTRAVFNCKSAPPSPLFDVMLTAITAVSREVPEAKLDTVLYMAPPFQNYTIKDAMTVTSNLYCYMYE